MWQYYFGLWLPHVAVCGIVAIQTDFLGASPLNFLNSSVMQAQSLRCGHQVSHSTPQCLGKTPSLIQRKQYLDTYNHLTSHLLVSIWEAPSSRDILWFRKPLLSTEINNFQLITLTVYTQLALQQIRSFHYPSRFCTLAYHSMSNAFLFINHIVLRTLLQDS